MSYHHITTSNILTYVQYSLASQQWYSIKSLPSPNLTNSQCVHRVHVCVLKLKGAAAAHILAAVLGLSLLHICNTIMWSAKPHCSAPHLHLWL